MLVFIPHVLNAAQLQLFHAELKAMEWSDGGGSTGYISLQVKHNLRLRLWADSWCTPHQEKQ